MTASTHTTLPAPAPYRFEELRAGLPPLSGDAKADLAARRRYAETAHRAGASGRTVVRLQCAAMDELVLALWRRACEEVGKTLAPTPVALVALGGYGRSELNPYSDIDLLVLH